MSQRPMGHRTSTGNDAARAFPFPAIAARDPHLIALAGLAGWMLKPAPQNPEPTRKLDIITKNLVANLNPNSAPVLSPDGTRLLYFADGKLRVRSIDKLEPDELPGTEEAGYFAWSPDSRRVAYVAKGEVWIQDIGGAAPTAIGPAPAGLAGAGGLALEQRERSGLRRKRQRGHHGLFDQGRRATHARRARQDQGSQTSTKSRPCPTAAAGSSPSIAARAPTPSQPW
jgi:hypothetical protein